MEELLYCGKSHFAKYFGPLKNIDSDSTVGIQCGFPGYDTLHILGVYLLHQATILSFMINILITCGPCMSHYPPGWVVLIMSDSNGDLGSSLGDKGKHEPNLCG